MNDVGDKVPPLVPGSDLSCHRIAALDAGGYTMEQIRFEHPSLTEGQIRDALALAKESPPPPGVEFPKIGFKHTLMDMSRALGAMQDALDEDLRNSDET